MWQNRQFPVDLVTFTDKNLYLMENFIFCAVKFLLYEFKKKASVTMSLAQVLLKIWVILILKQCFC